METSVVDDKFRCEALVFIDDLGFFEISREIEAVIENMIEGLDLYESFCKQHAKLIACEIEPTAESFSNAQFSRDSNVPPVSVRIAENVTSFRVEWQRNRPILNRYGDVQSVQGTVIRLANGRLKYPSSIFNSVDPKVRERFLLAEQSLAKVRKQQALLTEMRRLIRRLEYASKGVVPLDAEVATAVAPAEGMTVGDWR